MNQSNMPNRKKLKQETAAIRAEERAKRDDAEQLAYLEHRGHGHCIEAGMLRARISAPKIVPAEVAVVALLKETQKKRDPRDRKGQKKSI